jgi:Protein of unknown function (DUF3667)
MTGELVGAADILTGAAIARAVEPSAGESHGAAEGNCLNCGTTLIGAHCHNCGQKGHVHRTLHAFGHDFMHSVLHFDGKIWRTLPMLFWNPGNLTRRYVHGERAKFVSPLALFLFTVFLTFAAFNWLMPDQMEVDGVVAIEEADQQYKADRKEITDSIAKLESDKKAASAKGEAGFEWMDDQIERLQNSLKRLDEGRGKDIRRSQLAARKIRLERDQARIQIARLEAQLAAAKSAGQPTAQIEEDLEGTRLVTQMMGNASGALQKGDDGSGSDFRFTDLDIPGAAGLNKAAKHAAENPQLMLYKMQSNAYKYSWALIPISVPFVWLMFFWRRRFKMFDHAVFVTYSLTFMMLLGIVSAVLINFSGTEVIGGLALAFIPPIHMYRHIHHAYETSRFGAFWRMCLLSVFAMTALTLFAVLIVTLGVTG